MSDSWPEPVAAAAIFQRLGRPDPLASADFAEAFLDPLADFLRAVYPQADDHHCLTAAGDAILSVIRNPAVYNSTRGDLAAFLRMAARADLLNILASERRHHDRRADRDCVELPAERGNDSTDAADDLPSFDGPTLAAVIAGFTDPERRVFELMRTGERGTAAFAAALGITDRPREMQAREVKRVKDRLFKRLQRAQEES